MSFFNDPTMVLWAPCGARGTYQTCYSRRLKHMFQTFSDEGWALETTGSATVANNGGVVQWSNGSTSSIPPNILAPFHVMGRDWDADYWFYTSAQTNTVKFRLPGGAWLESTTDANTYNFYYGESNILAGVVTWTSGGVGMWNSTFPGLRVTIRRRITTPDPSTKAPRDVWTFAINGTECTTKVSGVTTSGITIQKLDEYGRFSVETQAGTAVPNVTSYLGRFQFTPVGTSYARQQPVENGSKTDLKDYLAVSRFTGNGNFFELENFYWDPAEVTKVTVNFWAHVRTADLGDCSAFGMNGSASTCRFQSHAPYSNKSIYWDFGDISTDGRIMATLADSDIGKWVMITLCAETGTGYKTIWINGACVASANAGTAVTSALYGIRIGGFKENTYSNTMKGRLDDFQIYNRILTSAEIRRLYHQGYRV